MSGRPATSGVALPPLPTSSAATADSLPSETTVAAAATANLAEPSSSIPESGHGLPAQIDEVT